MSDIQILDIDEGFIVQLSQNTDDLQLSDEIREEIEAIWSAEKQKKGDSLFDGTILGAEFYSTQKLLGRWIPYKLALAVRCCPDLGMSIRPVSVSGFTRAGDCLLLGKRGLHLAEGPGCFELAPSGGLDPDSEILNGVIDFRRAILKELLEETGIDSSQVLEVQPFGLAVGSTGIEICVEIRVNPILTGHLKSPTGEYSQLLWVPSFEIDHYLQGIQEPILPLSLAMMHQFFARQS